MITESDSLSQSSEESLFNEYQWFPIEEKSLESDEELEEDV